MTAQKDKKKREPAGFSFKDKKIGKLKGYVCSATVEKDWKTTSRGSIFSPQGLCGVPAKCRKIVGVEGRNSSIFPSEKGRDGRGRRGLSMDIRLKSRAADDISRA